MRARYPAISRDGEQPECRVLSGVSSNDPSYLDYDVVGSASKDLYHVRVKGRK
jgi:hypothetical protein